MRRYAWCIMSIIGLFASAGAVTISKQKLVSNEHYEMCGCKPVIWTNHFEGGTDEPNFSAFVSEAPGAHGTAAGNRVPPSTSGTWAYMTMPACVVAEMSGESNRLTGYIKAERFAYIKLYGEYTVSGSPVQLGQVYVTGTGNWKQFTYYFDFSAISGVSDVKLYMNIDPLGGRDIEASIDELQLCHFCDGTLQGAYPKLKNLQVLDGTTNTPVENMTPVFNKYTARYRIVVPSTTASVKIQPYLEVDPLFSAAFIQVNGNTVTSGGISGAISVNLTDEENYPVIDVVVNSGVSSCPQKTYYFVEVIPEEPLPSANLINLKINHPEMKLTPGFSQNAILYNTYYPPGTGVIQVIPVAKENGAQITVNGQTVISGEESQDIDLSTASTAVIVVTSAKDASVQKTYTVNFAPKTSILYVIQNYGSPGTGYTWGTAFSNLQDALAAAQPGSGITEIRIAAGYYYPDVNSGTGPGGDDDEYASFELIDGVTLKGGYPVGGGEVRDWDVNETVLSGDITSSGSKYSFHIVAHTIAGSNATIDGVIIEDGLAIDGVSLERAPAILFSAGSLILHNSQVRENRGRYDGAISNVGNGMLSIDNCKFKDNRSDRGASISSNGPLDISNSDFENGIAIIGGEIYIYNNLGATHILTNCQFTNYSATSGGAIYYDGNGVLNISNCQFTDNGVVAGHGGAIYITIGSLVITNATSFINNTAAGRGGAIYTYNTSGSLIIDGALFEDNSAGSFGGAIDINFNTSTINNTEFNTNTAGNSGGAIYYNSCVSGTHTRSGVTFTGNTAGITSTNDTNCP